MYKQMSRIKYLGNNLENVEKQPDICGICRNIYIYVALWPHTTNPEFSYGNMGALADVWCRILPRAYHHVYAQRSKVQCLGTGGILLLIYKRKDRSGKTECKNLH